MSVQKSDAKSMKCQKNVINRDPFASQIRHNLVFSRLAVPELRRL